MIKALLLLTKWELLEFRKSKVLLFWNLLFPLLLFLVLVSAFGGPASLGQVKMALADNDRTAASALYAKVLNDVFRSNEGVSADFVPASEKADIVVAIPKGFEQALASKAEPVQVAMTYDASAGLAHRTAAQIVRSVTAEFELRIRNGDGALRLTADDTSDGRAKPSYTSFLATGILVLTLLSVCIMGIVIPLVARREYGVLRTFQSLPITRTTYMTAFIGSRILLALLLSFLFLGLLSLLYDLGFTLGGGEMAGVALLVVLMSIVFSAIGLAVAGRLRSVAAANAAANLVFFPLVFLGDLTIPTQGFPPAMRAALDYAPSSLGVSSLRDVLLGGASPGLDWKPVALLALWGILAAVAARSLFVWHRR